MKAWWEPEWTEEKTLGNESDERAKAALEKRCRFGTLSCITSTHIGAHSCHTEAFSLPRSCKESYRFVVGVFLSSELLKCWQSLGHPVPCHTKLYPAADHPLSYASHGDFCNDAGDQWVNLSYLILLPTLFLLPRFSVQILLSNAKVLSMLQLFLQTAMIAIIKLIEPAFP